MIMKIEFPKGNEKHDIQPDFIKDNPIYSIPATLDFDWIEYHGKHQKKIMSIKKTDSHLIIEISDDCKIETE